jgi:GDP-L-fucose synthase
MVVPSLLMRIYRKEDPVVIWGDGSAIRDFAYATDCAEGCVLALYHGTRDSFVNLASGEGVSIKRLVDTLHEFIDFRHQWDTSKPSGFPRRVMDISRAREWIGYNPTTTLREGLEKTWDWLQANADEHINRKNYFAEA